MGMLLRDITAPDRKKIRAGYRHAGWLPRKMKWKNNLAPVAAKLANNFGPGGGK
jgi:hypothetical protein